MKNPDRILYAEDSENDIELTMAAFEESQLPNPVDVVKDGTEALDYLFYKGKYSNRIKESPVFILLNLKMPKLNGIEVLKEIRKSEEYKTYTGCYIDFIENGIGHCQELRAWCQRLCC